MKQNITLALEQDLLKAARAYANRRGISISGLLAEELRAKVEQESQYQQAKQTALALLENPWSLGGRGVVDREDLHDRAALR
ncbi:MAG: hypothetical protein FIA96_16205 [Betaproteobacteria bacterium]|nr:hypothetical protein [Betaproteobacteria bacterium]